MGGGRILVWIILDMNINMNINMNIYMNTDMNTDMNIEEVFPSLRVQFGPDGRADQLTFSQFLVEMLLARVEDFVAAGRLAEMRLIAKSSA